MSIEKIIEVVLEPEDHDTMAQFFERAKRAILNRQEAPHPASPRWIMVQDSSGVIERFRLEVKE